MTKRRHMPVLTLALLVGAGSPVAAQYSLFKPVPTGAMRELSTDRPDKTESPYTVDAGRFQIEADLATYGRDRVGAVTTHEWSLAAVNLKAGLLPTVDLQLIVEPRAGARTSTAGADGATTWSRGGTTARLKINVWGNDGGRTAFGIMPFVSSTPTGVGRRAEGGVILPLAIDLGGGWGFGTMAEIDFVVNDEGARTPGRAVVTVFSATIGRDLSDRLGAYAELFSESRKGAPWVGTADFGTTFAITSTMQLDGGVNLGLSDAAQDFNPFLGLSIRF